MTRCSKCQRDLSSIDVGVQCWRLERRPFPVDLGVVSRSTGDGMHFQFNGKPVASGNYWFDEDGEHEVIVCHDCAIRG